MIRLYLLSLSLLALVSSCKTRYERMLERELASGERHDSLFLGLSLGMDRKTFFEICWNYNKSGEMTQGTGNLSARYFLNEGLKAPAYLDFYPTFDNDTIVEMPALFTYKDWAPWLKAYSTDSLLVDVKQLLEQWYGPGFIEIKNKQKGNLWVKVDGNRRIRFFKREPREVSMIITDLSKRPHAANGVGNE